MNLQYMAASSNMSNITGLTVSMYKTTDGIKILLINPVSATEDMILDYFIAVNYIERP